MTKLKCLEFTCTGLPGSSSIAGTTLQLTEEEEALFDEDDLDDDELDALEEELSKTTLR